MQMVRVWERVSRLGVCKVSATIGEMQGWVSLALSVLKLTASQEARCQSHRLLALAPCLQCHEMLRRERCKQSRTNPN